MTLLNGARGAGVITRNGGTAIIDPGFVPFTGIGGTNSVTLNGPSAAIAVVDGPGSKLKLGP